MTSLQRHNLTVGSFISSPDHNDMNVANTKEMNLIVNVIWIVLLCGLIVSFAVFQALRYVVHRTRSYEVQSRLTPQSRVSAGLKKSVVCQMSTRVLGSEVKIDFTECTICLEEFADGQNVRVLPHCSHEFHVGCIDKWFELHSSCPNCRNCLLQHVVDIPQSGVEIPRQNMV
ncbi:hypothetical protein QVD17_02379 [Tagetes erecta]|uniref:RING-type E3 ubiquitin transferase n=1 Tax=Tagetes erecta TaxID=13708 RepID=A0AAD8L832_TARER|nr:hypothetical protein QVD17_02379 [Tagetes erecta]